MLTKFHDHAARQAGISRRAAAWIASLGYSLPVVIAVGLALPSSREGALWFVIGERHPVEVLTAILLFTAAGICVSLVNRLRKSGAGWLAVGFFGFFAAALLLVALEEIAWGQWIYRYRTPDFIRSWNQQDEVTLHNIGALQGNNEYLRMVFGFGGLVGVGIGYLSAFRRIAVPVVIIPWFLSIATLATLDAYVSSGRLFLHQRITAVIFQMGEVTELLIAIAGLLYVVLRRHLLNAEVS